VKYVLACKVTPFNEHTKQHLHYITAKKNDNLFTYVS